MAVQSAISDAHILSIRELSSASSKAFPFSNTLFVLLHRSLLSSHCLLMLLRDAGVEIVSD